MSKEYCALIAYREPSSGVVFRTRNLVAVINNWLTNFVEADIVVVEQVEKGGSDAAEKRWADHGIDGSVSHMIVECDYSGFHKTRLLNAAIEANPDYHFYIMADADAFLDIGAFDFIRNNRDDANLVFPYASVLYLDECDTRLALQGKPLRPGMKQHGVVISRQTGLCNVFSRDLYDAISRYDEAFINWGAEDDAFCFKTKRIGRSVIRNDGPDGTVLHLFHPKVNTAEYVKSREYVMNRKRCACIRRMSDDDFSSYLRGDATLDALVDKYDGLGRLKIDINWPCTPVTTLTIDSTIYDIRPEGLTFTKLMDVVLAEDGPEVSVQFIDNILMPISGLNGEQMDELNALRAKCVELAKKGGK